MNSRDLAGLPVILLESGERLGPIVRTYLDGPKKRIAGFAVAAAGGFGQVESEPKLDTADIHTLGVDVAIIDGWASVRGTNVNRRAGELLVLDEVPGRPVLTESGTVIGRVVSVTFSARRFNLNGIEIAAPHSDHRMIPAQQIRTIGRDYVIVAGETTKVGGTRALGTRG